jgi:pSer/pThr/pTyr-binding forkhead associated (FHA) protein/S1-C subfamily serine protease
MHHDDSSPTVGDSGNDAAYAIPELIVRTNAREQRFGPSERVHIGRDPENDIVCEHRSVSRQHATVAVENGHWVLVDASSRHGTHLAGRPITSTAIDGAVDVKIGDAVNGDDLHLEPATAAQRPGGEVRGVPVDAQTWVPQPLGTAAGSALQLLCAGREYRFEPPQTVTLGRDEACDVVCENPLVSRVHARVSHTPRGWVLTDAGSTRGTYWNNESVRELTLGGAMTVWLGQPDAGEKVLFSTAGEAPKRSGAGGGHRGRGPLIAAVVAVVLAGIAALVAILATRGGDDGPDLDRAKRATVRVETDTGWGSGTIISDDGLILTNAHVAAPDAPGQGVDAGAPNVERPVQTFTIHVTSDVNRSARPEFRARLVAADGYLDLALLRISERDDGTVVSEDELKDLDHIPLGDSDDVRQGDRFWLLGFPAIAESASVDLTTGAIGAAVVDPNRRFPGLLEFNHDATQGSGNSGGLALDEGGQIIGVPTRRVSSERDTRARLRVINLAKPLIDAVNKNEPYDQFRFVKRLNGNESATAAGFALPNDECGDGTVSARQGYAAGATSVLADFELRDVDTGQDLVVELSARTADERVAVAFDALQYDGSGCARFQPEASEALPPGLYRATLYAGPNYEEALARQTVSIGV